MAPCASVAGESKWLQRGKRGADGRARMRCLKRGHGRQTAKPGVYDHVRIAAPRRMRGQSLGTRFIRHDICWPART